MERFGRSVMAKAKGERAPEGWLRGRRTSTTLGRRVVEAKPGLLDLDRAEQLTGSPATWRTSSSSAEIQASARRLQRALRRVVLGAHPARAEPAGGGPSLVDEAVDRLREQGHVFDEEGAVWVRTTDFGDDKDRVIRRSNGEYTYFAADAAYYLNKGDRGFAHKIYLLGADHHGYVHRLKALAGAAGDDPEKDIEVLIGQIVSINGARLSKRAGNIIELDDLRDWLGDGCAALLARALSRRLAADTRPRDAAASAPTTTRSSTCSTPTRVRTTWRATPRRPESTARSSRPSCSTTRPSRRCLGALQEFPRVVAHAAGVREPHRVARYLEEIAGLLPPLVRQPPGHPAGRRAQSRRVHRTRLWLNDATGQVLRNGLDLLGVNAPERM